MFVASPLTSVAAIVALSVKRLLVRVAVFHAAQEPPETDTLCAFPKKTDDK
jgi:hypothetical protein